MKSLILNAPAKINLTLDVISKAENGYHNVEMIMQTVDVYDEVFISLEGDSISLTTNLPYLPTNETNTAYKAAKLFLHHCNILTQGVKIKIKKNIPTSAGLAGGSTDAAGVILGLNELLNTNLSLSEMMEIGAKVGADVPFCIMKKTAIARGLGEKLTSLSALTDFIILLAKPPISVSTKFVYEHLDLNNIKKHPDTNKMIDAINKGNIYDISHNLYNVLEEVTSKYHPIVKKIEDIMIENGALNSIMSGSGPTVFGIFDDIKKANMAKEKLKPYANYTKVTKMI